MPVQEKTGAGVAPGAASPTDTDAATGFARGGRGLEAIHELRLGRFSAVGLLILFVVLFGILRPEIFLTLSNFQVTVSQGVETVILGLAFLVPLCAGAYDLSIGAVMELSLA